MRAGLLSAGLFAGALTAQDPGSVPSAAGTGPMRELLARGVAAAPMTTGLSFALTITNGGRNILAGPWALRVPGASPLTLSFEETEWDSDSFEAVASIRNKTGAFVGGLRLDFLEITEGTSNPRSRGISLASPLLFGDLEPQGEASLPFRLQSLGLSPDSSSVVLRGIVTGVVAAGGGEIAGSSDPVAIDSDGKGALYVGDGSGQAIFRVAPDLKTIRKFEAGCSVTGVAVRRKSGEVFASCRDVSTLLRLSPAGRVSRTDTLGRALGPIRFGGKGDLYGAPATIVRLNGLSIAEEIGNASQRPLPAISGFDVGPDGTIWAVASEPEGKLLRIRSAKDIVALAGTGEGLGSLASPIACRVGPEGFVYVLERSAGARLPRVTVFDRGGSLARVWALPAGRPADLVFAADGRLEILWKRENAGSAVSAFRTF